MCQDENRWSLYDLMLNYHLMHPGGDSAPGDPNAAFCLDGTYHLHYILRHRWGSSHSFSFIHVTSPDMLHWTWQPTKLQPAFTGHGMFSGTGFLTRDGDPAVIYHGQSSNRNHIALAADDQLAAWKKPYAVEPCPSDRTLATMNHWDPDCFLINDTYYSISGGQTPPLFKSHDLTNWTYIGDFLKHDMPGVALGEDISCPNFFPLGGKWMLLCISHPFGCRYYLGDWDADAEQFVPTAHRRMNWRRPAQSIYDTQYRDFFAPESVLTADGRRVMWAWLATLDEAIDQRSIQSLPRELSLGYDGALRIRPLRELAALRQESVTVQNIEVTPPARLHGGMVVQPVAELDGDAFEIKIRIDRAEGLRKRFGFRLFADDSHDGLSIVIHPETGTLRIGTTEAPYAVADLADRESVELRIFVDKYLVEVFANDRQAVVGVHMGYKEANRLDAYVFGAPLTIRTIEIWRLKPTNQGFQAALQSRVWEPQFES